jgi:hypothetical protein
MSHALSSFLHRSRLALALSASEKEAGYEKKLFHNTELYSKLSDSLAVSWKRSARSLDAAKVLVFRMFCIYLVVAIISVATGACLPAYVLMYCIYFLKRFTVELFNFATVNVARLKTQLDC